MTRKHQSPEYQRNARVVRTRTRTQLKFGNPVACWRGGGPIMPGMEWDVGHINPNGGEHITNLAPEHRFAVKGCCRGNRNIGGSEGAAIRNSRRPATRASDVTAWPV